MTVIMTRHCNVCKDASHLACLESMNMLCTPLAGAG